MSHPIPIEFGPDARVLQNDELDAVTGGLPAIQTDGRSNPNESERAVRPDLRSGTWIVDTTYNR
jgi:hypothetical protein